MTAINCPHHLLQVILFFARFASLVIGEMTKGDTMDTLTKQILADTAGLTAGVAQKMKSQDLTFEDLCQLEDKLAFIRQCVIEVKQSVALET